MLNVYSLKMHFVGFFHCYVCLRKTTCEHSKLHANGALSHMHNTQPCNVPQSWYMLDWLDWSMYLRQIHTRARIIWCVHDAKELEVLSVSPFKRLSFPYYRHFVPFSLYFDEELNHVHLHVVEQFWCVQTAWKWIFS